MTGEKAMVMAWAPAVPDATTATLRTNLLCQVRVMKRRIMAELNGGVAVTGYCMFFHCRLLLLGKRLQQAGPASGADLHVE
jgi:hypothetical protein